MHGGCWTFRVPKAKGRDFFHEVAILAMGNELQAAVESGMSKPFFPNFRASARN